MPFVLVNVVTAVVVTSSSVLSYHSRYRYQPPQTHLSTPCATITHHHIIYQPNQPTLYQTTNQSKGLLKLVYDKEPNEITGVTGVIVGVHIVGEDACELIHYGMELVRSKRTISDVTNAM